MEHAGPTAWGSNAWVIPKLQNVWKWVDKCMQDAKDFSSGADAGGCAPEHSSTVAASGADAGGCAPGPSAGPLLLPPLPPLVPLVRRKTVKIFSFGLSNTLASFGQSSHQDLLKAYRNKINPGRSSDQELLGLWTRGTNHDADAGVMLVNAMAFHDPDSQKETQGHVGSHPVIMRSLLANKEVLKQCCLAVRRGITQCRQGMLEILVFCKSGRHRSVALAECLRGALTSECSVIGRPEVHHLSAGLWHRMHNYCKICHLCNTQGTAFISARNDVVEWMLAEGNIRGSS